MRTAGAAAYDPSACAGPAGLRAADRYLATLNGFRAWAPPGWALGNSAHEDYLDAVERWRAQHGLAAVCTLDVESRVMVPAP